MDRAILKQNAKAQIKGNIGILFVITLISGALNSLASMTYVLTLVVAPALSLGMVCVYLKLAQGIKPEIKELFAHFNEFWSALKVTLLTSIFTALWSLLLVVPGIIKAMAYSQAMYIIAENPGMGAREALKKSEEMMNGHKMDYFVLGLSFIGWVILGMFTFGLLYIWLMPYMNATMVNFYNSIKPAATYGGGYGTPAYNAPTYSAPTYNAPTYNAPANNAPTYEAPRMTAGTWYCPQCGTKNEAAFCGNCGARKR